MTKTQQILKMTTIGGSSILAVGSIIQLTKVQSIGGAVMPILGLLVSVSAFSYAMGSEDISFVPKVSGTGGEGKSNYVAGKCWTCSEADVRAGRCTKCGTKVGGNLASQA